jgi:hypothetical protein
MGVVVVCRPPQSASQIPENEADVPRPPRLIPEGKPDEGGRP